MRINLAFLLAIAGKADHIPTWIEDKHRLGELRSRRLSNTVGTVSNANDLDETGCSATVADGGWGYCGPASCTEKYMTCAGTDGGGPQTLRNGASGSWHSNAGTNGENCKNFADSVTDIGITDDALTTADFNLGSCQSTCTQETTGVCSARFLAGVIKGDGVKSAFCNDKWLIIKATGEINDLTTESDPKFNANLNDVPFPPAAAIDGVEYRTGIVSIDTTREQKMYYPLDIVDYSDANSENNIDIYDVDTGAGQFSYLIDGSTNYGLPADNAIGMAINGQPIFPIYNNVAKYTPQKCEVDRCNLHVGQGGGSPHFHGDMFGDEQPCGTTCLYGPSDYTNGTTGHPPVVGFSYDGHLIYGRYLDTSAPGYAAPLLDVCGGHSHTEPGVDGLGNSLQTYHYHTQIFDATVESGQTATEGEAYVASTPGPFQCFKGDLSSVTGSSAHSYATATFDAKGAMNYHCCGMTDYYFYNGLSFPSPSVDSSSQCTVPADPTHGSYSDYSGGERTCTAGETIYSGNACIPSCDDGYEVSGMTRCVGGSITETATCVLATPAPTYAPTTSSTSCYPFPTSNPTSNPSKRPSSRPTPTSNPTSKPTAVDSTVTIDVTFSVEASAAPTASDESSIKSAVATAIGVDTSDITDFTITSELSSRRRLFISKSETSSRRLATYIWTITFTVKTLLPDEYSTESEFTTFISETLGDDEFESSVMSSSSSVSSVDDVEATSVDDDDDDDKNNGNNFIMITIASSGGAVVLLCIVGVYVYSRRSKKSGNQSKSNNSLGYLNRTEPAIPVYEAEMVTNPTRSPRGGTPHQKPLPPPPAHVRVGDC